MTVQERVEALTAVAPPITDEQAATLAELLKAATR